MSLGKRDSSEMALGVPGRANSKYASSTITTPADSAANAPVIEAMQIVRLPYHLSALTQAAARAALAHTDALLGQVEAIKEQRDRIVTHLRRLGLTVPDSDANFVHFGQFQDQAAIWQQLLTRGVLVRDVGLPGWLRVTAGTPAEVDAFFKAVEGLNVT